MLKKILAVFWLYGLASIATVNATEGDAIESLVDRIKGLQTYQANFELRVNNENGRQLDLSEGIFSIQKPDKFRWDTKREFEQLIVADGRQIYTYDPDLEQVTLQNQSRLLADSPLLLLTSGANQIAQAFKVTEISTDNNPQGIIFLLQPRAEGAIFESVHLLFEENRLVELLMSDTLGQKTTVRFSNIKINHEIEPSLFQFIVPEGVDLVDSREILPPDTDEPLGNDLVEQQVENKDS